MLEPIDREEFIKQFVLNSASAAGTKYGFNVDTVKGVVSAANEAWKEIVHIMYPQMGPDDER